MGEGGLNAGLGLFPTSTDITARIGRGAAGSCLNVLTDESPPLSVALGTWPACRTPSLLPHRIECYLRKSVSAYCWHCGLILDFFCSRLGTIQCPVNALASSAMAGERGKTMSTSMSARPTASGRIRAATFGPKLPRTATSMQYLSGPILTHPDQ